MGLTAGDINAGLMLGMMALTISVPASMGDKPRSAAPYIAGALGALVLFAALLTYVAEPNIEGKPYRQILLASLCFGVSIMSLPRFTLQATMALLIASAGLFSAHQFTTLVTSEAWTAAPEVITLQNREREEALINQLQGALPKDAKLDDSQGWLLSMGMAEGLPEAFRAQLESVERTETFAAWHTPLTGLYVNENKPMGIWYDGGGIFEIVPMDSRTEKRPSSAPQRQQGPLLGKKSPYN